MAKLVLVGVIAAVLNLVPASTASATCDPVTLHGSGCTQSIRCLPTNVGLECL